METFENEQVEQETPANSEYRIRFECASDIPEQPVAEPTPAFQKSKKKKEKNGTGFKVFTAILLVIVLALGCICGALVVRLTAQEKRTDQMLYEVNQNLAQLQEELASKSFTGNGNSISGTNNSTEDGGMTPGQVYAKVVDSVIAVTATAQTNAGTQISTSVATGSGFVLTEDGYVVTNYHVVEGATALSITVSDGTEYSATLCGYDSANDIAVLKAEATSLQAVTLGSSDDLIVGDQVAVIGNPLGELTATLTVGYISAKDRVVTTDGSQINMLQTDAAVNSGNSGGPIFNMKGEVVGIITAKYSGTSTSGATIEGIGFAIPMDDVTKKIYDLKEYGYVTGAYLGVAVQDMDKTVAEYYGLPYGAYVYSVTDGYCAEKAGVLAKDIIVALGEYQVTGLNSLSSALQNFEAGDTTTVTVWRGGVEIELKITLDEKPRE